jgi:hypothetical protein
VDAVGIYRAPAHTPEKHPEYGTGSEAKLLAGLMGHNLCMDIFGGPSERKTPPA